MQSKITRRAALTGTATAAAALVAGGATVLAAEADIDAIRDLWTAWCTSLAAVRDAHEVMSVNGVPVGVENRERQNKRLQELTDAIAALPPKSTAAIAIKLAHWKWYRIDFYGDADHRRARVILPACDALAEQAGIDFDRIALEAGLIVSLPDGRTLVSMPHYRRVRS